MRGHTKHGSLFPTEQMSGSNLAQLPQPFSLHLPWTKT